MSAGNKYDPNYGPKGMDLSPKNIGNAVPPAFSRITKTQKVNATPATPGITWNYGKRAVSPKKRGGK